MPSVCSVIFKTPRIQRCWSMRGEAEEQNVIVSNSGMEIDITQQKRSGSFNRVRNKQRNDGNLLRFQLKRILSICFAFSNIIVSRNTIFPFLYETKWNILLCKINHNRSLKRVLNNSMCTEKQPNSFIPLCLLTSRPQATVTPSWNTPSLNVFQKRLLSIRELFT